MFIEADKKGFFFQQIIQSFKQNKKTKKKKKTFHLSIPFSHPHRRLCEYNNNKIMRTIK